MNDLFDVPPTRPMPADLHERVLAELSAAPDPRRNRAPRWIAPVIAATLVAGAGGGAIALHRSQPVANPMAPVSTSSRPDHPLSGDALVAQCRQTTSKLNGFDAWAPAGTPGVLFHDGAGHIAVCLAVRGNSGMTATDVTDPVDSHEASGTSVDAVTQVGDSSTVHGVAAGVLPDGADNAMIDNDSELLSRGHLLRLGRYWMFTTSGTRKEMLAEPSIRTMDWNGHLQTIRWFGQHDDVGITGTSLVSACSESFQSAHADRPVLGSLLTPDRHGVLLRTDHGGIAACIQPTLDVTATASLVTPSDPLSPMSMSPAGAFVTDAPEEEAALGGVVPKGITRVTVSALNGTQPASLGNGYWAWSQHTSVLADGVVPVGVVVRMFDGSRLVHTISAGLLGDTVVTGSRLGQLALRSGTALQSACRGAGVPLLRSWGGHAQLVQTASGTATCLVDAFGHRPLLDTGRAFPANLSVDRLANPRTDELPLTVYAGGGVAPAGTTDITFRTPMGDVPATVKDGHWVFELAVTKRSVADPALPATAMVTTNGSVTSYPVTLG